ncbi:MAG: hypothetical protein D6694_09900 [Gammaproteobacteria bacterium]|nr:MAG: hypothetical protein D6694_09900 [Gammaproteobacteria bacterium]
MIVALLMLASIGLASAQNPAYNTPFTTSITYQNISSSDANITFTFYPEGGGQSVTISKSLPAGAGSSLFIGNLTELPSNFSGSAVMASDQPVVATLVQIPQNSTTVKNRPLSNGFSSASSQVLVATVLKNKFNTTTKFSVQNASGGAIDLKVQFFNADDPNAAPIELTASNIPVGSAKMYDLGQMSEIPDPFNGSAVVTATAAGTQNPAEIVASALELSTNGAAARAFEGVNGGARTVYMPSALCNAFGATSVYAVQNAGTAPTSVTVAYSSGQSDTRTIDPGKKESFNACKKKDGSALNSAGFSGSATITSTAADIVVIGKVGGGGRSTAFLGETSGSSKLALPYVRWTSKENYDAGKRQRGFIAVQNIGTSTVSGVVVQYLNKNGEVVGTHTLPDIPAGEKQNSNASKATLASGHQQIELDEFGNPESNPGGGFGGAVIVQGPSGSQLIATVRISTGFNGGTVAEDYNGIAVQ